MKKLTISGVQFDVNTPYEPGQQVGELEAKVLNQTRAENVGNNLRETIKEKQEAGASQQELQTLVSDYDAKYTFAMGGAREPVDPLEKECRRVVREVIRDQLQAEGRKIKDIDPAVLEAEIDKFADQDDVVAEAKKRIKARSKKASISLAGFGLGAQA